MSAFYRSPWKQAPACQREAFAFTLMKCDSLSCLALTDEPLPKIPKGEIILDCSGPAADVRGLAIYNTGGYVSLLAPPLGVLTPSMQSGSPFQWEHPCHPTHISGRQRKASKDLFLNAELPTPIYFSRPFQRNYPLGPLVGYNEGTWANHT